jgi:hypothetical protein
MAKSHCGKIQLHVAGLESKSKISEVVENASTGSNQEANRVE